MQEIDCEKSSFPLFILSSLSSTGPLSLLRRLLLLCLLPSCFLSLLPALMRGTLSKHCLKNHKDVTKRQKHLWGLPNKNLIITGVNSFQMIYNQLHFSVLRVAKNWSLVLEYKSCLTLPWQLLMCLTCQMLWCFLKSWSLFQHFQGSQVKPKAWLTHFHIRALL